jgi:phosphoenolpyruvate-protein kinase (PTS system EI component)
MTIDRGTGRSDDYIEQLLLTNDELEMEVQIQSEENEKLRQEILRLETAYKNNIKELKALKKAGRKMYHFIEEGIMADLFHDEVLDEANLAQEKWYDLDKLLNQHRRK